MIGLSTMYSQSKINAYQRGTTLTGLIFAIAIISAIAVLGMKVVPEFVECESIKKAIIISRDQSSNQAQVRASFDKQVIAGYITTLKGKDLDITIENGRMVVSFSYEKRIPLVGPASLLLEFNGSTANK